MNILSCAVMASEDRFRILEEIKIKVKGKKYLTRSLLILKMLNLKKLLLKLLVELSQTSKMELFVKIVNSIKLLTIFTKSSILNI